MLLVLAGVTLTLALVGFDFSIIPAQITQARLPVLQAWAPASAWTSIHGAVSSGRAWCSLQRHWRTGLRCTAAESPVTLMQIGAPLTGLSLLQISVKLQNLASRLPLPHIPHGEHALIETIWILLASVVVVPLVCSFPGGSATLGFLVSCWLPLAAG